MMRKRLLAILLSAVLFTSSVLSIMASRNAQAGEVTLVYEPTNPVMTHDAEWEYDEITEANMVKFGPSSYGCWYRGDTGSYSTLGYATSTDGVAWTDYPSNPILPIQSAVAYYEVVEYAGCRYVLGVDILTEHMKMWNITTATSPSLMFGGMPVFYNANVSTSYHYHIFNAAVVVLGGVWHMLIEAMNNTGDFVLLYSYSTFAEHDFDKHVVDVPLRMKAGNPEMAYIQKHDAFFVLYGDNTAQWRIRSMYAQATSDLSNPSSWIDLSTDDFSIGDGVTDWRTDPCIVDGFSDEYGLLISYTINQAEVAQCYYSGDLEDLYETLTDWVDPSPPDPPATSTPSSDFVSLTWSVVPVFFAVSILSALVAALGNTMHQSRTSGRRKR